MESVTWEVEQADLATRIALLQVKQHDAFWAGRLDEVKRLTDEQMQVIAETAGLVTANE